MTARPDPSTNSRLTRLFRQTAVAVAIVVLVLASGMGVGAAARTGTLIPAAFPFAVALLVVLRLFGPTAERWGWSLFTIWLGTTYLATGGALERVAVAGYGVLAVAGALWSPLFLAAGWLLHPVWDFLPRPLPAQLVDLPVACLLFDLPIGIYLAWATRRGRWTPGYRIATKATT